jgi:hypothetical protein
VAAARVRAARGFLRVQTVPVIPIALRAMRDLRREVKDLTRKLRDGMRSGKCEADGPR